MCIRITLIVLGTKYAKQFIYIMYIYIYIEETKIILYKHQDKSIYISPGKYTHTWKENTHKQ